MRVSPVASLFMIAAFQIALPGQVVRVGQWEVHEGKEGFVDFTTDTDAQRKDALNKASIPAAGDAGWSMAEKMSATDSAAKYVKQSKITKPKRQLDFTYFQSIVTIPPGYALKTFEVYYDKVDDAARVWIYNERNPKGVFLSEADMIRPSANKATADLKAYVVPGDNRIVVVQYDQHPPGNNITGVRIKVDGAEVKAPTDDQIGVVLYDGDNFTGLKLPYTAGTHDIFSSQVGLNDMVSSVKVKPGWRVTLYEHFKMGGKSLVLTADTPDLKAKGFNNITSGVKIEKIN